jgi:AmiR/NasT family two-component response regulator
MHQHKISAEEAFQMLVKAFKRSNIKLRKVSELLITTGELRQR